MYMYVHYDLLLFFPKFRLKLPSWYIFITLEFGVNQPKIVKQQILGTSSASIRIASSVFSLLQRYFKCFLIFFTPDDKKLERSMPRLSKFNRSALLLLALLDLKGLPIITNKVLSSSAACYVTLHVPHHSRQKHRVISSQHPVDERFPVSHR